MGTSSCIEALIDLSVSCFQEPDYGALYEGRNPGFYVEANPMPTFKVQLSPKNRKLRQGDLQVLRPCVFVFWAHLWSVWRSGCGLLRPKRL